MAIERSVLLLCVLLVSVCVSVRADDKGSNVLCDHENDSQCWARNGKVCNDVGLCKCGKCECETGFEGPTCEICPTCVSPCDRFRQCVACKVFGTGSYGIMECLQICDAEAMYQPVDGFNEEEETSVCKYRDEDNCIFSFRVGEAMDGFWNIYVKRMTDCSTYDVEPVPTKDSSDMDNGDKVMIDKSNEDHVLDNDFNDDGHDFDEETEKEGENQQIHQAEVVRGSAKSDGLESGKSSSPTGGCASVNINAVLVVMVTLCNVYCIKWLQV